MRIGVIIMEPTTINPIFSVFLTMGFFGLLFTGLFYGIMKLNNTLTNRKLKRKLAAARMAKQQPEK